MQTYRSVSIVHNVAQAGAFVLAQLAIVKHLTRRAQRVLWNALGVVGLDDIRQHKHIVHRLALPRVRPGPRGRMPRTSILSLGASSGASSWMVRIMSSAIRFSMAHFTCKKLSTAGWQKFSGVVAGDMFATPRHVRTKRSRGLHLHPARMSLCCDMPVGCHRMHVAL